MKTPSAFPIIGLVAGISVAYKIDDNVRENGMSLRDYFAAKALQGLYANPIWLESVVEISKDSKEQAACTARGAYNVADAMIAERDKVV